MYRLHIDFPLGNSQQDAILHSQNIEAIIKKAIKDAYLQENNSPPFEEMNYRLCLDGERNNRNYCDIMSNGIPSQKKIRVSFQ